MLSQLSQAFDVLENVDLSQFNTFAVKAQAKYYVRVRSVEQLHDLIGSELFRSNPYLVLGGGSNILFTKDFDGLVVHMDLQGVEVIDENEEFYFVRVGAGQDWSQFVDQCIERGWNGLENLALVPGTVGGAAVQNIGAYGVEVAERIVEVHCMDPKSADTLQLPVDECDYGYRTSTFKTTDRKDLIVTAVVFALKKTFEPVVGYKELAAVFGQTPPANAFELAQAVKQIRRKKLPDPAVLGSAGSFFKNPVVSRIKMVALLDEMPQLVSYPLGGGRAKLAAGWLIEAVGMKGKRIGDAGVYERQALVLVNHGQASGAQIKQLADEVAQKVKRRFGVQLEPEPVII